MAVEINEEITDGKMIDVGFLLSAETNIPIIEVGRS